MLRLTLLVCGIGLLGALAWAASVAPSGPSPAASPPPPSPPTSSARSPDLPPVSPSRPAAESSGAGAVRAGPRAPAAEVEIQDPEAFPPLPTPGANDWLSVHREDGQTFEEFRTGPRRIPTPQRRALRVRPLDDVAAFGVPVAVLTEHLAAFYGVPCVAMDRGTPPAFSTRSGAQGQPQDLTTDVLDWLRVDRPADAYGVVAVTTRDLYPEPSWNFVFGQAGLRDGTGVFSFARMEPGFPLPRGPGPRPPEERVLVLRRCLKVVTHEVGHMFGMEHCIERRCLMNGSNHVAEMDGQPLHLCPTCLRKVAHATHVAPLPRYRTLEAFYRRVGLVPEADWVAGRLAALTVAAPAAEAAPASAR